MKKDMRIFVENCIALLVHHQGFTRIAKRRSAGLRPLSAAALTPSLREGPRTFSQRSGPFGFEPLLHYTCTKTNEIGVAYLICFGTPSGVRTLDTLRTDCGFISCYTVLSDVISFQPSPVIAMGSGVRSAI